MKNIYTFLFLLFSLSIFSQNAEKHALISVVFDEIHTIKTLVRLGVETDHGVYVPNRYVKNFYSETEIAKIKAAGFQTKMHIEDWQEHFANPKINTRTDHCGSGPEDIKRFPIPENFELGSQANFFTYQEMLDNLDAMAAQYPNLITPRTEVGNFETHNGNPLYWLRMSKNPTVDENEPEVFYNALHHAREVTSLSQLIFFMWYMLENYGTNEEVTYLLDHTELYFMPCVNPDGYIYNEMTNPEGGGLWRKNRRDNLNGDFGVDLNRNYDYQWGLNDTGSSPATDSEIYRGPSAASEPETQAINAFCEAHDFLFSVNYHSFGEFMIYPWGYSAIPTEDSTAFRGFAGAMTRYNKILAGTGMETIGQTANGVSDDWMYGEQGIFTMTPEIGTTFWTDEAELWENCQRTLWMNLAVANMPHEFGWAKDLSDFKTDKLDDKIDFEFTRTGLTAGEMTVSLAAVSPEILTTGDPISYNLNLSEKAQGSITYSLDSETEAGTELEFLLIVSSPFISWTDTLRKTYVGERITVLSDEGNDTNNWDADGNWDIDFTQFHSAPSSFGDSPNGDYGENENTIFSLAEPLNLIDQEDAILEFWARWDIEEVFDYAQILASTDNVNFTPLCGRYTKLGSFAQDEDQPIWDGRQTDWVKEEINLEDYLGEPTVFIQFRFVSDSGVNGDGFNFDDVVLTHQAMDVSTEEFLPTEIQLNIRPNPSTDNFIVELLDNQALNKNGKVLIYNSLGTIINEYDLTNLIENQHLIIDTKDWVAGMYFLNIFAEGKQTLMERLVLIR